MKINKLSEAIEAFNYVLNGGYLVPRSSKEDEEIMVPHPEGPWGCTRRELYYGCADSGSGEPCPDYRTSIKEVMENETGDILHKFSYGSCSYKVREMLKTIAPRAAIEKFDFCIEVDGKTVTFFDSNHEPRKELGITALPYLIVKLPLPAWLVPDWQEFYGDDSKWVTLEEAEYLLQEFLEEGKEEIKKAKKEYEKT